MIAIKRLSDAVASGDNVVAVIRGSAVNQDGPSGGLTVPSGPAQQAVVQRALDACGVPASKVSYVEVHGTATKLGDPIEVNAMAAVLGKGRSRAENPLLMGSVKTNIGHLEAAAGIASLIKVALALHHGVIPAHLHFQNPSPFIDWQSLPCTVPTRNTPWPAARQIAGINSFGYSGTNAHVLLEAAPRADAVVNEVERPRHLLVFIARSDQTIPSAFGNQSGFRACGCLPHHRSWALSLQAPPRAAGLLDCGVAGGLDAFPTGARCTGTQPTSCRQWPGALCRLFVHRAGIAIRPNGSRAL